VDETFVEIEAGMLPTNLRWRLAKTLSRLYFVRWLRDVVDALSRVVARQRIGKTAPSKADSPAP
jgi:hypothetical protein